MAMEFLTDTLFTEFGRSDYIGGIDNEALDFGQLDQYIHVATDTQESNGPNESNIGPSGVRNGPPLGLNSNSNGSGAGVLNCVASITPSPTGALSSIGNITNSSASQAHLPESPPDSGSEPPYSPGDLQGLTIVGAPTPTTTTPRIQSQQQTNGDISATNLPSLAELSPQSTLDLHHSHLDLLTTQHHHQHHHLGQHQSQHHEKPPQQVVHHHHINGGSPYMRGNDQEHNMHHSHQQSQHQHLVGIGEITICKHEEMLLQHPDTHLMLHHHHHQNGSNLLDSYRNDLSSHGSLLSIGAGQLNTDDLARLMPTDVYSNATPIPTSTISIRTQTPVPTSSGGLAIPSRKRKLSQPDINGGGATLVKPETGSSLSPMCGQHMDQAESPLQNLSLPSCTSDTPSSSAGGIDPGGIGQNPDTTGGGSGGGGGSGASSSGEPCPLQCIRFTPFQQQNWHVLCNQSLQELPLPYYNVDADKGFNFSNSDDAFVCQKKNHFQITCHAKLHGNAVFVRTSTGLEKIKSFHLHFYGVKLEAPNHTIRIEQSQSDRSKKPFHPVPIDLQNDVVSKITVVRLHFSETTSNNMRKKGRPNPEQRYFQLVVGLHAHTHSGNFPIISHGSERIIVRASNPGQFESDVELCWQRGITQDSIFHAGRVGINTDRPDESLVVHGNLKVSGHIVQPSDSRAKQEIGELDTSQQLRNMQKIRIVKYRYEPDFAVHSGLKEENDDVEIIDTGVIAQEVREVLPDAVQEAGNIVLSNGQVIEKFLLVNKDRILMENIGAVKELCKVTGSLETRIEQLEKINSRLIRIQQFDRKHNCSTPKCKHLLDDDDDPVEELCSNKTIQKIIIILVVIMAICLLAISALYFLEHRQRVISTSTPGMLQSHEHVYNRDTKPHYLTERTQVHYPQQNQPEQEQLKVRSGTGNLPAPPGDISYNEVDEYPAGLKKDQKMTATTMIIFNNNQIPVGTDYDTDNLAIAPAPPGEDNSSEKVGEATISNLPPSNSFDGDRNKKLGKGGKAKSGLSLPNNGGAASGLNTKKPTFSQHYPDEPQQKRHGGGNPSVDRTNKGHADATEDQDLQYLSNNNDSDDPLAMENNIPIPGTSYTVINRTVNSVTIGVPVRCEGVKTETIECQSVCCEESNRLLDPLDFADTTNLNSNRTFGGAVATAGEKEIPLSNTSTSSLCNSSPSLQPNNNINKVDPNPVPAKEKLHLMPQPLPPQHQQQFVEVETLVDGETAVDDSQHGSVASKGLVSIPSGLSPDLAGDSAEMEMLVKRESSTLLNVNTSTTSTTTKSQKRSMLVGDNCYPVRFLIRSESFNATIAAGEETICLNGERRQILIYTIPISKFMRETKLELIFIGPNTLQWSLCRDRDLKRSTPTIASDASTNNIDDSGGGIFQVNPNKSIFHLHLPSYGYFDRSFELHAAFDFTSTCDDKADDSNNLLQYNIRIFRDCD